MMNAKPTEQSAQYRLEKTDQPFGWDFPRVNIQGSYYRCLSWLSAQPAIYDVVYSIVPVKPN